MSISIILTGTSAELQATFFPALVLTGNWSVALQNFQCYNSIPNIDSTNSMFRYIDNDGEAREFRIPEGSYEVLDLSKYIAKKLGPKTKFFLKGNDNTLQCEMLSSVLVDFFGKDTPARILGYRNQVYDAGIIHISTLPINIIATNSIRIDCDLATNSYINGTKCNTIHEFPIKSPPGYKLVEIPANLTYFPVTKQETHHILVRLTDQDGNLVNFRGETITVRLHLRQDGVTN